MDILVFPSRNGSSVLLPSHRTEVVLTHLHQYPSTLPPSTSLSPTLLLFSYFLDSLSKALSILIKVTVFLLSLCHPTYLVSDTALGAVTSRVPKSMLEKELLLCSFFSHLDQHNDVVAPEFTAGRQ